jgi:hypothetical protein
VLSDGSSWGTNAACQTELGAVELTARFTGANYGRWKPPVRRTTISFSVLPISLLHVCDGEELQAASRSVAGDNSLCRRCWCGYLQGAGFAGHGHATTQKSASHVVPI